MTASLHVEQVDVDGLRGPVLTGGNGRPGEAVLFVHGNPGAGSDWLPLMGPVSEFATVIAPDMPGFGGTQAPADQDYTLAGHACYLAGIVERFGLQKVHLVAHDFGGPFALTWAAANTDRVASVTLINTGVLLDYHWHALARLWRTPVIGELTMRASSGWVTKKILRVQNPGLSASYRAAVAGHLASAVTKRAVLRLYRSTSVGRDMNALVKPLQDLDPDTLVVWGDSDSYLPTELADRQRRVFRRARVEILPGVGHWAWFEQPERVAGLVLPFLRAQLGAPAYN